MVRKSVTGFRLEDLQPYRVDQPFYEDAQVDRIIDSAGGLPPGDVLPDGDIDLNMFDLEGNPLGRPRDERLVDRRTELVRRLEIAARNWAIHDSLQKKATHRQQEKAFTKIEAAAKHLLDTLDVGGDGDIEAMPLVLRFGGLQAQAAREAPNAPSPKGRVPVPIDGDAKQTGEELLRESMLGVVRLCRWAGAARERSERLAAQATARAERSERATINGWRKDEHVRLLIDRLKKDVGREPRVGEIRAAAKREKVSLPSLMLPPDLRDMRRADVALKLLIGELGGIWLDVFEKVPTTVVGNPASPNGARPGGEFLAFLQACLRPLSINRTDEAVRDLVRRLFQGKGLGKSRRKNF